MRPAVRTSREDDRNGSLVKYLKYRYQLWKLVHMLSAGWMDPGFGLFVGPADASNGMFPGYLCHHTARSGLACLPRSYCSRAPDFKYLAETRLDSILSLLSIELQFPVDVKLGIYLSYEKR